MLVSLLLQSIRFGISVVEIDALRIQIVKVQLLGLNVALTHRILGHADVLTGCLVLTAPSTPGPS